MLKYEARLIGIELPKPMACHSQNLDTVREWAKQIHEKYPSGRVEIYETKQVLIESLGEAK